VTQQSARGDRHLWGGLSRFITPRVAGHFERVCAAAPQAFEHPPLANGPTVDLAARLRAAWD
jgi:DNA helicase-2/ATP-dependent DNA helicase PcrA